MSDGATPTGRIETRVIAAAALMGLFGAACRSVAPEGEVAHARHAPAPGGATLHQDSGQDSPEQDALPALGVVASLPVSTAPVPAEVLSEVLERFKFYGDLRLRHESSFDLDDKPDRNRERLRLRVGVNYQVNDDVLVGARMVTGDPDDPNSPHVTFGDAFDNLDLSLDRAFLSYQPSSLEGAFVTAGKFNHPFARNQVYGELVWDADVQPEGLVIGRTFRELGPFDSLKLTLGGYSVLEQATADDAYMWVSELAGRVRLCKEATSNIALSYYGYSDVTPDGSRAILVDNAGNATVDLNTDGIPDEFVSDFGILNALTGVTYEGWSQPVTFSAEYVTNLRADIDADHGWATGVSVGKSGGKGDWRMYYQWQVVEQDAVFSAFAQDDFLFATNHRSHVLGANYQLTDKIDLHLWTLVSARDDTFPGPTTDSDAEQWRVRLDLNVKF